MKLRYIRNNLAAVCNLHIDPLRAVDASAEQDF